eukprot:gene15004-21071_t
MAGALAGGMQSAQRGGLSGLQANGQPQQGNQGRFQGQSQLPPSLQQLNAYQAQAQARPGMANGNILASNPAGAAGGRAGMVAPGMGAQARTPGVDGRNMASSHLLGGGPIGQAGLNMPTGYSQNPLATALGTQQQAALNMGINRLQGINNLQNLQNQRQQQQQQQPGQQPTGPNADLYVGLRKAVVAASGGVSSEFSMQDQDFPALPGASQPAGGGRGGLGPGNMQRSGFPALTGNEPFNEQMSHEQVMRFQQQQLLGGAAGKTGSSQDKSLGGGPAPDRFGLLGLMPLLKMSDQDLTMLALGTDLTSLGLNLNSSDSLHKSFVSPLSDNPVKQDHEFDLPACYKHNPQRLQPGYLTKFKEETLFYMFYSMPQDEGQLIAADELSSRGWWFHKRYRLWMIHAPNTAMQKNQRGERGSYLVFDPAVWEVVPKGDLEILYDDVEQPPRLPRPKHMQTRH